MVTFISLGASQTDIERNIAHQIYESLCFESQLDNAMHGLNERGEPFGNPLAEWLDETEVE